MRFIEFLRTYCKTFTDAEGVYEAFDAYLLQENQDGYINDLKDKDFDTPKQLRDTCAQALVLAAGNAQGRKTALQALVTGLEQHGQTVLRKFQTRAMKRAADKQGEVAMAAAATTVPVERQIGGERVLHFTTAFAAIVASSKLRINRTSDQGCIFCVPARYANEISQEPPANVKQIFDIHGDVSYYLEFNLEGSRNFESYNSQIDKRLKGQKELKVSHEVLDLDLRNPQWYEWKGKASGGWALVPGPYAWKKG